MPASENIADLLMTFIINSYVFQDGLFRLMSNLMRANLIQRLHPYDALMHSGLQNQNRELFDKIHERIRIVLDELSLVNIEERERPTDFILQQARQQLAHIAPTAQFQQSMNDFINQRLLDIDQEAAAIEQVQELEFTQTPVFTCNTTVNEQLQILANDHYNVAGVGPNEVCPICRESLNPNNEQLAFIYHCTGMPPRHALYHLSDIIKNCGAESKNVHIMHYECLKGNIRAERLRQDRNPRAGIVRRCPLCGIYMHHVRICPGAQPP